MAGFVDEAQAHVKGGDGGAGSVSFRREAHVPRGGPDGGDGGKGGDVWFVADPNVASLLSFRDHPHRRAGNGAHGQGQKRHGASGGDLVVKVPEGTTVKDREGTVVADLVRAGHRFLAAAGGRGGRGNASFLSNRRRAPSFAEQGEVGEEHWLDLELKLMADVALVGFPNAGKSTLISRISAARPKIADYPFTTLEPHLGVVRFDEHELIVADIPGLIEGASEGKGLGHQFLRHVERARVLLLMIDLASAEERPPAEQERVLLQELGRYRPELLDRPRLVVGAKADAAAFDWDGGENGAGAGVDNEAYDIAGAPSRGLRISALTGENLRPLLGRLAELVTAERAAAHAAVVVEGHEEFVIHRPAAEGFVIERGDDGAFVVIGRSTARAVAVSDITNADALAHVQTRLKRLGVDKALARAGARHGDVVHIEGFTFEYEGGGGSS
ncbi:MAG TPA: GTPase ObgE [Acidimicrobiales bacterium]|nr:GTPase ObgE [Acidimicrobiales bacterium]